MVLAGVILEYLNTGTFSLAYCSSVLSWGVIGKYGVFPFILLIRSPIVHSTYDFLALDQINKLALYLVLPISLHPTVILACLLSTIVAT